jgi:hypothetical protein
MSRATEFDLASENLSPEKVQTLFDFPASAALSTQSSGPGRASILFAEDDSVQRGLSVHIFPAPPLNFSHITPYQHWGLNE